MAFQGADQIDPTLLTALISGGGRRSSGLGLGSLLEPGPTPQAAWAGTIAQSPFYQGAPSQSGAFGQIAQAILPVVLANAAAGQASEAERNRQIFLDSHLKQAEAEIEQAKMKLAQEAYNMLLLSDPDAQSQLRDSLPEGAEQTISAGGRKMTIKREAPFPSLAEQAAAAKTMGLGELSLSVDAQGRPKLSASRVKPSLGQELAGGLGALSKSVDGIAKIVLAQGGDPALAAELGARDAIFKSKQYVDLNDGQRKVLPSDDLVKVQQEKISALPSFKKNLLNLKEASIRSPFASAGATALIGQVWNGTIDQLGGVSLGPLGPEIDRQAAQLKSAVASEKGLSPELRQKLVRDLSIPAGSAYNSDYARIVALKQIVAYQTAKMNDDTGRLSDQDVQSAITALEGGNSLLGKMFHGSQSLQTGIDTILASVDSQEAAAHKVIDDYNMAVDWKTGRDLGVGLGIQTQIAPTNARVLGQGPNKTPIQTFEESFPTWAQGKVSPENMTFDKALDAADKMVGDEMVRMGLRPRRDLLDQFVARFLKINGFK